MKFWKRPPTEAASSCPQAAFAGIVSRADQCTESGTALNDSGKAAGVGSFAGCVVPVDRGERMGARR
jgi:hypothetical protein